MAKKQFYQSSVQSDLFNYLKPEQQEFIKPILRILKPKAQMELCYALIDYLETGIPEPPLNFNLGIIFMYIIHNDEPKGDRPGDAKYLYPLHRSQPASASSEQCRSIGSIIKQMFNK